MPREGAGRASVSDPILLINRTVALHRAQRAAEVTPSYRR